MNCCGFCDLIHYIFVFSQFGCFSILKIKFKQFRVIAKDYLVQRWQVRLIQFKLLVKFQTFLTEMLKLLCYIISEILQIINKIQLILSNLTKYYKMKTENIFFLIIVLSAIHLNVLANTRLNFIVQHQIQAKNDYVQVRLEIKANNNLLTNALKSAQQVLAFIIQKSTAFCEQNTKNNEKCGDIIQAKKVQTSPLYRVQSQKLILKTFQVTQQLILRIQSVKNIGILVDQLVVDSKSIKLLSFDWKSKNELLDDSQAINQGIQEGKKLCKQLGEQLDNIVSIQEIVSFQNEQIQQVLSQEKQQNSAAQDQSQQINQNQYITLKFEVQCKQKKKSE